jgi:hypothetical protein
MSDGWIEGLRELGPIYPFEGAEATLLLACLALWIGWMIWQLQSERGEYERTAGFLRERGEAPAPDEDEELRRVIERRLDRARAEERL